MRDVGAPFQARVDQAVLEDLKRRLARTRWPDEQAGVEWQLGVPLDYMRRITDHWRDVFDWRAWEARINRHEQRIIDLDGQPLHVLIERGSGPNPLPLLLVHGWPGSFLEFIDLIDPLAHPERFGGREEDAFTVIVPSLPGFGFSPAAAAMPAPGDFGLLWHKLMVDALGFDRYVAQGGDKGATSISMLALRHPEKLAAIHLNMLGLFPYGPLANPDDAEENAWLAELNASLAREGGYVHIQSTKPQTLGYGLTDSPAGMAAWILEKFHAWTIQGERRDPPFSMDHLLANVMLYWINGINAANRTYVPMANRQIVSASEGARVEVPTGFTLFGRDIIPMPPRSLLERLYNVQHIRTSAGGGHFAAMENGQMLIEDMRAFFSSFR